MIFAVGDYTLISNPEVQTCFDKTVPFIMRLCSLTRHQMKNN